MNKQTPPSTPPSTPPRKKNNISSNDLDPNYLIFLKEKIPILDNEYLLKSILEYCKIKDIWDKKDKIREIKNILKKMFINVNNYEQLKINNYEQLKVNNNKKLYVLKKNNKIIKLQEITVEGLIEAIINVTLYYYELNNFTVNSSLNIIKINKDNTAYNELNNKKRFMQTMNLAEGVTLGNFIINLYKNQNKSTYEKNNKILDIFKKIYNKLDVLQTEYLFIHGDFNSGNIIIDEDENIKFIDFEYSSIKLPCNNNKKIILITPVPCNNDMKTPLDLSEQDYLKTIDMYHLIENLYILFKNKNSIFTEFLEKLKKIFYKKGKIGEEEDIDLHLFERNSDYFNTIINYKKLFFNNFNSITYGLNNSLTINNLNNSIIGSLNNGSPPKPIKRRYSTNLNDNNNLTENNISLSPKIKSIKMSALNSNNKNNNDFMRR